MDIDKIVEHGAALVRANAKLLFKKIFCCSHLQYKPKTRFFSRAGIVIRGGGGMVLGNNLMLGKNSTLTAQGGRLVVGDGVGINRDVIINAHDSITIGKDTIIAPHVCIYDHDHLFDSATGVDKKRFKTAPIVIGERVWIGAGAIILRGSVIGDNCVIGAGCVIKGTYPAGSVVTEKKEYQVRSIG